MLYCFNFFIEISEFVCSSLFDLLLSALVNVKFLAAKRLIKKFHRSIASRWWWVVYNVGHNGKFYSIGDYKLCSE